MAEKNVDNGWALFEAWCKSKGGVPINGGNNSEHTCWIGPIDEVITPEKDGVGVVFEPAEGIRPALRDQILDLEMKGAELKFEQAKLRFERDKERIKNLKSVKKGS